MARARTPSQIVKVLRAAALLQPEADEGIACAGTSLEKRTIKVRKKAFLFLGQSDVMLKLRDSLDQANELAANEPGRCKVGAHGWITVTLADAESFPLELVTQWIAESFRLLAPKQTSTSPGNSKKVAKSPSK